MDCVLGLFPLTTVLMPGASLRLHVFEDRYKALMAACIDGGLPFGVVWSRNGKEVGDDLEPVDVGTSAAVRQVARLSAGRLYVIASGLRKFRMQRIVSKAPYWQAQVAYIDEALGSEDVLALRCVAIGRFKEYLHALLSVSGKELEAVDLPCDAAASSYIIADALQVDSARKQALLESPTVAQRLRAEIALLDQETSRLRSQRCPDEASEDRLDSSEGSFSDLPARFSTN